MPRSVAALTALVALSACADGIPDIDTAPGEVELERFVAASGFPDRETFVVLDGCPIEDGSLLLERALRDVDDPLVRIALDAPPVAFVTAPNSLPDGDPYVACGRVTGDFTGALVALADAPGDGAAAPDDPDLTDGEIDSQRDGLAAAYAARFGDPPEHLTVEQSDDLRGGTTYHICIVEPSAPERDSCEVAWFGGDLVVTTAVTGPGAADVDLAAIEERFRPLVQLVIDGLATAPDAPADDPDGG